MSQAKHIAHAVLGAVSILAVGVVLGIFLDRVVLQSSDMPSELESESTGLDATHEAFLGELSVDLGLTEVQVRQVHEILSRHQTSVNEAWTAVHSLLEAAIDSVTTEIEAVLDSTQREGLHDWLLERHGVSAVHNAGAGH